MCFLSWSTSALSSLIASINNGTIFSYWTVMYFLSTGAGATASGNTFLTSCAETPTYVMSVLNPNSAAVSLKL